MYNIYAQHGEVMAEDAKIRFLFNKINHSGLESAVKAMKAKITTKPTGTVTYTTVTKWTTHWLIQTNFAIVESKFKIIQYLMNLSI